MCNHVVAMTTVQREITVPADPDAVWAALTDDELRDAWLQDAEETPREISDERADEDAGEVSFRWARPGEPPTEVRFTVRAVPAGTRVVVVETAPVAPTAPAPWGPLLAAMAARVPAFALA